MAGPRLNFSDTAAEFVYRAYAHWISAAEDSERDTPFGVCLLSALLHTHLSAQQAANQWVTNIEQLIQTPYIYLSLPRPRLYWQVRKFGGKPATHAVSRNVMLIEACSWLETRLPPELRDRLAITIDARFLWPPALQDAFAAGWIGEYDSEPWYLTMQLALRDSLKQYAPGVMTSVVQRRVLG